MRISDGSSDVCSSDLLILVAPDQGVVDLQRAARQRRLQVLALVAEEIERLPRELLEEDALGLGQLAAPLAELGRVRRLHGVAVLGRASRWDRVGRSV